MDVVRYADTYGYEWDIPANGAWRYRDYLVRAFNADVPFDQLVREQIAGDLLPNPRIDARADQRIADRPDVLPARREAARRQRRVQRHPPGDARQQDRRLLQGVPGDDRRPAPAATTTSSTRSPSSDYYALAGVFMSARWVANTLDTPDRNRDTIARLRALKRDLRREVGDWWNSRAGVGPTGGTRLPPVEATTLPLEHPLRPWQAGDASRDRTAMAATWCWNDARRRTTSRDRAASERDDFRVVADFREGRPAGLVDRRRRPARRPGSGPATSRSRSTARGSSAASCPPGWFTDADSPRLNGAAPLAVPAHLRQAVPERAGRGRGLRGRPDGRRQRLPDRAAGVPRPPRPRLAAVLDVPGDEGPARSTSSSRPRRATRTSRRGLASVRT